MKSGTPEHIKTKRLARILGCSRVTAVGLLESLWHFTTDHTPQGDVGRYSDEDIADHIGWPDDPAAMTAALVESGWVEKSEEYRLVIHDWADHCPDYVKKMLKRKGLWFVQTALEDVQTKPGKDGKARQGKAEGGAGETPSELPPLLLPLQELWDSFVQMRIEKREPMSDNARKIAIHKLQRWGLEASRQALENSIVGRWQGLFHPDERKKGAAAGGVDRDAEAKARAAQQAETQRKYAEMEANRVKPGEWKSLAKSIGKLP